ncbi:MAG: flagellar hook capping FlgD N-terminal domain-containing protein [Lachnospiraceae bacterium]|nr:flagellar hook capping FlgD N-terminal domain-containing protein [Lachnospiraceae bacterium]
MAISAQVINGKVYADYTSGTSTNKDTKGSDSLDKDAFLKILVAEMQYQDPLEPSSNTEWVTQMASFSQIEQLQDVTDTINEQKAAGLVGKRIIIAASDNTSGEVNYVTGKVQCIEKKSDGLYFSINDNLYSVDKLYAVVDDEYYDEIINGNKDDGKTDSNDAGAGEKKA